jgi:hypothetical protein
MGHISFWLTLINVNLMGDNIDTIRKNTETLIDARKEVGLKINVEKLNICCYLVKIAT